MKKISLILSMLITIILLSTYSYATVDATIFSEVSKNNVQPGEEVEISLYLNDLEFSNKGVDEIEVKLKVKNDVLEPLTVDSIVTNNGKITVGNNELKVEDVRTATSDEVIFSTLTSDCDYKIFIDLKNPIVEKQTKLFTLKCKVKDDVDTNLDIENVINFNVDLATQVTAADLRNGMTSDMTYSIKDSVPLTVVEKSSNNNSSEDDKTIVNGTTGNGSTGSGSTGTGTTGNGSTGSGSTGNGSTGNGSTGSGSTGNGSTGSGSTGTGTTGNGSTGSGSTGNGSTGSGTTGSGTTGNGSTGSGTTGSGTTGNGSTGSGTTGSGTTGTGTTGNGTTGNGSTGSGTTGSGSTGTGTTATAGTATSENNVSNGAKTSTSGNPTTAKASLPAAGLKIFILPIVLILGIAIFSYKKYMKYKDIK